MPPPGAIATPPERANLPNVLTSIGCDAAWTLYIARPAVKRKHTVRLRIRLLFGAVLCAPLGAIATIAIAERAMRMPFHAIPPESATAGLLVSTRARLEPVEVHAADGALLRAWFFTPNASNGAAVIALHG